MNSLPDSSRVHSPRSRTSFLLGPVLLALIPAACSEKSPNESAGNTAVETARAPAPTVNASADAETNAVAVPSNELSRFVGKHPSEAVDGMRFLDEPAVEAAVAATVADPKIRDFVFHYNGPDAPIVMKDGRVLAWGCERHNCGYHNWSVAITPDGSSAEVCFYHNDDSAGGPATWYLPASKTEKRPGNCPSD
jgi:hypothetical protein